MIDYYSHLAALRTFRSTLASTAFANADTGALRDRHLKDADNAESIAMLGSLIDHMVWHAASDGTELALLERAANLWGEGLVLYSALGEYRFQLERALANPTDAQAVAAFNTAATQIQPILAQVKGKNAQIQALKVDVHTFSHIKAHPRQLDKKLARWCWSDIFLARRTDALVKEIRRYASTTQTSAFALGVLSSYSANVCGSTYLGQVVGGPRRAHRFRDRLARNTIGSWFFENMSGLPSLSGLAHQLKQHCPSLPVELVDVLSKAFGSCYDLNVTPQLPSFEAGYQRLLKHLELLDQFALPSIPALPIEPFITTLYGDPNTTHQAAMPQDVGVPQAAASGSSSGGSGIKPQTAQEPDALTHADAPDSTEVECGAFWEAVGLSLLFVLGAWVYCAINWVNGDRCPLTDEIDEKFGKAFPDGIYIGPEMQTNQPQALTSADVDNAAQIDQVVALIGHLFDTQCLIWEALNKAHDFLATHGLIYPHDRLTLPRYQQFLAIPAAPPGTWPRLAEHNPNRLQLYPLTGTEQPAAGYAPYSANVAPSVFVVPMPASMQVTSTSVGIALWHESSGNVDHVNCDLDGDRGFRHPCWDTNGSIADTPISVAVLSYSAQ